MPSHQYTSTDSPLTIPCSLISPVSWEQVKKKEIEEVQWHFAPKLSSGTLSDNPEQLFSLNLEKLTWKKGKDKGLSPVYNIKNGNLSLTKSKATVEERGRYTCSMKFKNGRTLETTVDVVVLESKSHFFDKTSSVLHSPLLYLGLFFLCDRSCCLPARPVFSFLCYWIYLQVSTVWHVSNSQAPLVLIGCITHPLCQNSVLTQWILIGPCVMRIYEVNYDFSVAAECFLK